MTRKDRIAARIEESQRDEVRAMRRGDILGASKCRKRTEELRIKLALAEEYEAKPVREFLSREEANRLGIPALVLECHLAADFLTDCASRLKESVDKAGLVPVNLIPEIADIRRRSERFASMICAYNEDLMSLMVDNEELIAKLHADTLAYLSKKSRPKSTTQES